MAGGKETPRQKMIGMMYLVLTALLALNVSKSILDAFVAIEENTQKANITHYERGQAFKSALTEEYNTATKDEAGQQKKKKVKFYLDMIDKIDVETANMIEQIDNIKLDIMQKSGENITDVKDKDEETILWKKYDKKNSPLLPIRMNLMAVQAKDQYDVPMHEIIGEDIKNPTGSGKKLWEDYNKFRKNLTEIVGTYKEGEKQWSFKAKDINNHKDNADLIKEVQKMVKANKVNPEDVAVLEQLYSELSKQERSKVHDMDNVHWIGKTFDHSPLVAAIASLSAIQQEILSARATAVGHLKSKISTGEYSFNKIMPLAYGPLIGNSGDEVELQVMMAAFDSDNQPVVTVQSGGGAVEYPGNGTGLVKTKIAGGNEMTLAGTVAIKNKSGVEKRENWTHTIKIMKPEGTVSLPDMNVLYRGYDNKVEGVASGYDQTVLAGNNVTLTKVSQGYIGKPGPGKTATITISGKNSVTNKTVSLGTFTFRVMNLPPAQVYFGGAANGEKGSKFETKIFTRYPPEIPLNVSFTTLSWEMDFMGRSVAGTGSVLDAAAQNMLKQAKPGNNVSFLVKYKGPDNLLRQGVCIVKF
jgi:hypothetical protein